jgi:hypothetical protein
MIAGLNMNLRAYQTFNATTKFMKFLLYSLNWKEIDLPKKGIWVVLCIKIEAPVLRFRNQSLTFVNTTE